MFSGDETEEWSNNIIDSHACYSLVIHSLPGNKFLINNDDKNGPITIGNTGIFQLNLGVYPITSLCVSRNNHYRTYPTIIDIIFQALEED